MIRFVLKIGAVLVAGILIYNFFFGTSEEKEQSRKIFGQVKDVVVSVSHLVKSEKSKFDAGKYDAALEKLGGAYQAVRSQVQKLDASFIRRLDELEKRKAALQSEIDSIEQTDQELAQAPAPKKGAKTDAKAEKAKVQKSADQQRRKEELQRELDQLFKDSEALLQQAQEQ
jgi:ABC-type transporter Mla subunit MlaD